MWQKKSPVQADLRVAQLHFCGPRPNQDEWTQLHVLTQLVLGVDESGRADPFGLDLFARRVGMMWSRCWPDVFYPEGEPGPDGLSLRESR